MCLLDLFRYKKTKFFIRPDQVGFDGIIGNDLLKDLVWHFDRDKNTVAVFDKLPSSLADSNVTWLPFDTFFGKISFAATITFADHTLQRNIIVDTGSRYHMIINDAYFKGKKAFPTPAIESAGYSLSGMAKHHKATLPQLEIGNLVLNKVVTNIIREDEDDFWTVGSALLSQFELIIDYPNSKIGFIPSSD